ncbi:MAG: hypothetical protein ABR915_12795, partial [Thermoguttaceae bacterium]
MNGSLARWGIALLLVGVLGLAVGTANGDVILDDFSGINSFPPSTWVGVGSTFTPHGTSYWEANFATGGPVTGTASEPAPVPGVPPGFSRTTTLSASGGVTSATQNLAATVGNSPVVGPPAPGPSAQMHAGSAVTAPTLTLTYAGPSLSLLGNTNVNFFVSYADLPATGTVSLTDVAYHTKAET